MAGRIEPAYLLLIEATLRLRISPMTRTVRLSTLFLAALLFAPLAIATLTQAAGIVV